MAIPSGPANAGEAGLVTVPSAYDLRATVDRFEDGVRAAGWVVFTEIDHAAAAKAAGLALAPRTVVIFGNPKSGTPAMASHPTLAVDLPMRVLVWQDDSGHVFVTRSTGQDTASRVFARHGVDLPAEAQKSNETFLDGLVVKATK